MPEERKKGASNLLAQRRSTSHKDADGSCISDMQEAHWLRDFLPAVAPYARIMTFGYHSNYLKSAPKRTISNCAQELLLGLLSFRTKEAVRVISAQ